MKKLQEFIFENNLLLEAYSQGITLGELKEIYKNGDIYKDFFFDSDDNKSFKPSDDVLYLIDYHKNELINLQNKDNEYLFYYDIDKRKYKISKLLDSVINEPALKLKKMDSAFFEIGSGEIQKAGANKGDIIEILFSMMCYLYVINNFLNKTDMDLLKKDTLDFIKNLNNNDKQIIYDTTINSIKLILHINLKYKDVISFIKNADKEEIEFLINKVITYINQHEKEYLNEICNKLFNNEYSSNTTITIESFGNENNNLDKSDVRILIKPDQDSSNYYSLKDKSTTFSRIELKNIELIKEGLEVFNIKLSTEDENKFNTLIERLKKIYEKPKTQKNPKPIDKEILDAAGYKIASLFFNILLKEFKNKNPDDKIQSFIFDPLFSFIKGKDEKIKNNHFTVADFLKTKKLKLKPNKHYTKSESSKLYKKLSIIKIISELKNRVNQIGVVFDTKTFLKIRYSSRNLNNINPRFQLYIEIANLDTIRKILEILSPQGMENEIT